MANEKVTYEIRLKDLMSKTLRGLSSGVSEVVFIAVEVALLSA